VLLPPLELLRFLVNLVQWQVGNKGGREGGGGVNIGASAEEEDIHCHHHYHQCHYHCWEACIVGYLSVCLYCFCTAK
jgi:hypothetical protein